MNTQHAIGILIGYFSRKLVFSAFSVIAILVLIMKAKESGLADNTLCIALPSAILCITVICITFVTGLAKIDVAVAASYGKKDA